MIEPQNTMLPVAAEPTPATVPDGEAGFGEMLAQTLGMIPQIDPNAVQQITGDSSQQDGDAADLTGESNVGDLAGSKTPVRQAAAPVEAAPVVMEPARIVRPVDQKPVDGRVEEPIVDAGETPLPARPEPTRPVDGIWHPVTTDEPAQPSLAAATSNEAQAEPTGHHVAMNMDQPTQGTAAPTPQPEPGPAVPVAPELPKTPVVGDAGTSPVDPSINAAVIGQPVARQVGDVKASPVDQGPIAPVADRGLPKEPGPQAASHHLDPTARAVTSDPAERAVEQRPDATVQLVDSKVSVGETRSVPVGNSPISMEPSNGAVGTTLPISGEGTAPATSPVTPAAAPAAPVQHTALAERVIQAVELQANQPPPRTMVVDIPEIEGLRLVVSVRAGAEVHVVPTTASTASEGVQPFLDELQGVLENRGFVMTGDGRRRGKNPNQEDQQETAPGPRPGFRRPQPTDDDLRI